MVLDDAVARLRMAEFPDHLPGSPEMLAADLNCFPRPPTYQSTMPQSLPNLSGHLQESGATTLSIFLDITPHLSGIMKRLIYLP
jgi:hypothetical protein